MEILLKDKTNNNYCFILFTNFDLEILNPILQ